MSGQVHDGPVILGKSMTLCGGKKRGGEGTCSQVAGWGTAHPGTGRCKLHGGASPSGAMSPQFRHGRYSLSHRENMAMKAQQFINDPAPGDLTGELAILRALLQTYLDRFEHTNMTLTDIQSVYGMIDSIGRMVERISKILNETALTQAELQVLQAVLADMLIRYIDDDDRRTEFMGELAAILQSA
jgi:hypothetical protein